MPNVPDFRNLDRQQRADTDRFSIKNVIGSVQGQAAVPPPGPSPTPTPTPTPTPVTNVCVYNVTGTSFDVNGTYTRTQSEDPDIPILFIKGNYTIKYNLNEQRWLIEVTTEPDLLLYYNLSQDSNPPKTGWLIGDGDDAPDIGYYTCPPPSPTPTPTVSPPPPSPTPTPTITPTPLPTGYQTPPWNFTTYIELSGVSIGDALRTWTVSQFDPSPSLVGPRITYRQTYNSTSNARFALTLDSLGNHFWQRRDVDSLLCIGKVISPALSAQTITKLPGDVEGWVAGEECVGNAITFYVSGFN